jgi:hypothetical protein
MKIIAAIPLAVASASCTPETTSFSTTDQTDPSDPDGAAYYEVRLGKRGSARVHVWSNGGYFGTSDEPMTHVGFDIYNTGPVPLVFDTTGLGLTIKGKHDAWLPPPTFVRLTPLAPPQITIGPGSSTMFDAYYELGTRPTNVQKMHVRWELVAEGEPIAEQTTFVRDDDAPVVE